MAVRTGLFVIAVAVVAMVSCAEDEERTAKSKALLQKCLKDSGTTVENLHAFVNGNEYPDGLKCAFKCLMQGHKVLLDDGTVDVERVVTLFTEKNRASSEKCKAELTATDLCERAHQYEKCFLANEPEFFRATVTRLTS